MGKSIEEILKQMDFERNQRINEQQSILDEINNQRDIARKDLNNRMRMYENLSGSKGTLSPPDPEPPAPGPTGSPLTILQYVANIGPTVVWNDDPGTTFTLDPTLPNYSYTIDTSFMPLLYFPAGPPPTPSAFIGVTIGNTVIDIGGAAFSTCFLLSSVTFSPTSVLTTINALAFSDTPNLISIEIPASVTSIASDAFLNSGLTTVFIANNQLGIPSPAVGVSFFGATVTTFPPVP